MIINKSRQCYYTLNTLSDAGDNYESTIASLDSYFMPKKKLIYECYNFLNVRQNAAETIDVYITCLWLLTTSCDYGGFKRKWLGSHCDERWFVLFMVATTAGKDLSHELLQTTSPLMKLSDCHASKMENFQQHDDSINAIRRLAIDKKDTSNDRNRLTKWCEKSGK